MAARLKVFVTSDGLTDYVVAASSRPKALAAWGVRQDLFKEGRARETNDPVLTEAALADPGQVMRRAAGGREALAKLKPAAKPKPKTPSKAALKKAAEAERALQAAQAAEGEAADAVEKARQDLAAAEQALSEARSAREKSQASLEAARRALEP